MFLELTSIDTVKPKAIDYMFLVEAISHKFRRNNRERIQDTEIYSVCCEELVKAIDAFNPVLYNDPARFIYRMMRNGVIEHQRYNKRKKRFAEFVELDKDMEVFCEEKSFSVAALPVSILTTLLSDIEESDLKLLTDVYLNNKRLSDVAQELNLTRMAVYNRIKKIVEKVRQNHPDIIEEYGGIINVT